MIVGGAVFLLRDEGSSASQQLIDRADEICVESRTLYNDAGRRRPGSTEEAARQADALLGISQDSLRRLRRLEVPEDTIRRWNAYLGLRAAQVELLRVARDAAKRGDAGAYEAAFRRIDGTAIARFQAARDIGLVQCSRSSSASEE